MHVHTRYDVAVLSDFRYQGGTSASMAEEIQAQARAGLSTVLVHVPAPHLRHPRPFNPRIIECLRTGAAELAVPGERVTARVLVIRQPRIFTTDPDPPPQVTADEVVMVVNQPPHDHDGANEYYDLGDVASRVHGLFGDRVQWSPTGPLVRETLRQADPTLALTDDDWHNIIDVDDWYVDRSAPVGTVPVIGRHSRSDPKKWPTSAEEIQQAYPAGDDIRVRILGGADHATRLLGGRPDNWEVLEFGAVHPREFLPSIDFFVYFHDPDWVEAFGRTILEAMASGVPVIIGEHFRPLFGDAALYATPAEVPGLVRELYADWDRYQEISQRGRAFAADRFGYASHVVRLHALGSGAATSDASADRAPDSTAARTGADASAPALPPQRTPAAEPVPPAGVRRPVMLVSANGIGLGHVTRLMALARRLPADVPPVIATQSQAAPLVQQQGFLTEYIPSRNYLAAEGPRWNAYLAERLAHLIAWYGPRAVVVDTPAVYNGVLQAIAAYPDIEWVWSRRAMWKEGLGSLWIERGQAFDHVLEPGEFAAPVDVGLTVAHRHEAHCVGPVTYLDREDLLDRGAARTALGLTDRPAALVQMGAEYERALEGEVTRRLHGHGFDVVTAQSPLLPSDTPAADGTRVIEQYPLSPYLAAFDLMVTASGYNSYHEVIRFGIPSVLCPQQCELDDQSARARYAAKLGTTLMLEGPDDARLPQVFEEAADPTVRAELTRRCHEHAQPNGAEEAARWVAALARGTETTTHRLATQGHPHGD